MLHFVYVSLNASINKLLGLLLYYFTNQLCWHILLKSKFPKLSKDSNCLYHFAKNFIPLGSKMMSQSMLECAIC